MRIPLLLLLAAAASHHYGVFVSYYVQRKIADRVRSAEAQGQRSLVPYRPLARNFDESSLASAPEPKHTRTTHAIDATRHRILQTKFLGRRRVAGAATTGAKV